MAERPNVLLIFTDQQRFDTIHALNNPVIRTPNLDRLVREGVAFTNAFSPSPVCVSARCSLHYGQYPANSGCYDNCFPMPQDGRPSFMDLFTDAGYRTHGIGKCHFTPESDALRGFQTRERQEEGRPPRSDDYTEWLAAEGRDDIFEANGVRGELYYIPQVSQLPAAQHPSQWVGDRSTAFVRAAAAGADPWLLFASFIHPHPPFAPPNPWHKLYRAGLMPLPKLPDQAESLHTHINRVQNRYKYRDQGRDLNLLRAMKAHYYACISFVDYQVGRILSALEETGQLDNTLVLFTADHGEHLGDYGCFGKRSMHDSCARIPLLARLPGRFRPGVQVTAPASLVDVMPTLLAAGEVAAGPAQLDGVDLAALAAGAETRDMVFSQFQRGADAIYTAVTAEWKYAYSAADNREFLFDRQGDPEETRNRAGIVFCRDRVRALRERLQTFLRESGEEEALDDEGWRAYPVQTMPADPDAGLLIQDPPGLALDLPGYTAG